MFTSAFMFVLGGSFPIMLLLCNPVIPPLAVSCLACIFSSPEPKARVSYCHSAPSSVVVVRKLFTFSTSSPEPLDGFWWNLVGMKYSWSLTSVVVFSARSTQGLIQGGAKIGQGGPLLQETSSSDPKATATNRMHGNDLEVCRKKCCYFWVHSEVKFLTRFWRPFGLSHFAVF